jgi:hypothetical protein
LPSLLRKYWIWPVLLLVLVVAGFMRLYDVNFDQNTHQHPDERAIADWAMNRINIPPGTTLDQLLDPARSPLNPRINGQACTTGPCSSISSRPWPSTHPTCSTSPNGWATTASPWSGERHPACST